MPTLRIIAVVLLLLAGVAARRAALLPWAASAGPDSTQDAISPIGITRTDGTAPVEQCRWHSGEGDVALCAPAMGQAEAYYHLELSAPMLALGAWLLLAAGALALFPLPGAGVAAAATSAAGALATGAAAWYFGSAAGTALGRDLALGGSGWMVGLLLPAVGLAGAVVLWHTRMRDGATRGSAPA